MSRPSWHVVFMALSLLLVFVGLYRYLPRQPLVLDNDHVGGSIQEAGVWLSYEDKDAGVRFSYPGEAFASGMDRVPAPGKIEFFVEAIPTGWGDGVCLDPEDIDCRQQLWKERKAAFAAALTGAPYRYRIGDEQSPVRSRPEVIAGSWFVRVVNAGMGECSLDYVKVSEKGFLAFRVPLCDDPGLVKPLGSGLGRSETADQEARAAAEALLSGANAPRVVQERIDVLRQVLATVVMD